MALAKIKKVLGFRAEQKALTLTDPEALNFFNILPTSSGVSIGPGSAMRVPAVACAVGLISETIGALPFKLYDRESKAALSSSTAYRLVHDEANEWTSAAELRRDLTLDALLHGAGHAQVIRLADGSPFELHRLEPGKVQRDQEADGEPFYRVSTDNGQVRLSYRDVLRVDAIGGISPITLGREAIALALSFESHIGSLFANGGRLALHAGGAGRQEQHRCRIYDRLSLALLADPYTVRANGLMRYHARRRVVAGVVRADAFRKLQMAA